MQKAPPSWCIWRDRDEGTLLGPPLLQAAAACISLPLPHSCACACSFSLSLSLSVLVVVFVLARLSICKWCISGEKMLLMIYLHLALIYANVSLFPIVWLPDCLPPCLPPSLSLPLFAACFLWEFVISVSFRLGFFNFSCTLENYYGIFKSFLFAFRDFL